MSDLLSCLEKLARRAAEPLGIEVAWVEFKGEGHRRFVRVYIDRESGVGLGDCEKVSERLGTLLDVEDPIESSYTLEVSTPGLDRPLRTKRDYERFTGRLARIWTGQPVENQRRFLGRLMGMEGNDVLVEDNGRQWRIPLAAIESARLEVELFRPGSAGKPKKSRRSSKARGHS